MSHLLPWFHKPQSGCLLSGLVPLPGSEWLHFCFSPVGEAHWLWAVIVSGSVPWGGWMVASPKIYHVPECDLICRIFAELIKWRLSRGDHLGFRVSPKYNNKCSFEKTHSRDTGRKRRLCEDGGWNRNHKPRNVRSYQTWKRQGSVLPSSLWRECGSTYTLISDP